MKLSTIQTDRAAGVLLGQAVGDALGVPYEFGTEALDPRTGPRMSGGGLGGYAPGEWSDDTQMAITIVEVSASGADLTGPRGLGTVARNFERWLDDGPADIGAQTSAVLHAARRAGPALPRQEVLRDAARALHGRTGRTAGNGALMRTAVVGLTRLDDRRATAAAARAVAELTHWDPLAGDSCVLWSEAVRRAVVDGVLDVRGGVDLLPEDRRGSWEALLDDAESRPPADFRPNGFTVTALQAAWSSISQTLPAEPSPDHVGDALRTAISVGHDTDTVAAIAGGLLGARYGASGMPFTWTRLVNGWPGLRAPDLVRLAVLTARGGRDDGAGWPSTAYLVTPQRPLGRPHPLDPDVLLGTTADLDRAEELGFDAVVSLCRLGREEFAPGPVRPQDHALAWIVDDDDPATHQHLRWALDDAARAVKELREEGRRVLLHCVAAQHRTPSVALRYSVLLGAHVDEAAAQISSTLGRDIDGLLWMEAQR
ncbi:ADP-ribosylglycohydrolase family protein [Ornithinimicrobium cerasi]|uniref:ADP-ribosylglycohydrolase family protein n=1 Tax=Ornithinimicrobium cerasi TaxID=2248773 RepID=UPI000EFE36B0|nr:ADP-ribosylglycohydrolase family protein [Ornithinimicrobium cerasi]